MKKGTIAALSTVLLVGGFATWTWASAESSPTQNQFNPWNFMQNAASNPNFQQNFQNMMGGFNGNFQGGMMGGFDQIPAGAQLLDEATLKQKVNDYLAQYQSNEPLAAEDFFKFKDTSYYVSVIEKNTGRGALELIVNPVTGAIRPEQGPNMMWNLKYGMTRYMGGMMGGYGNTANSYTDNQITKEQAVKAANDYLAINLPGATVGEGAHSFYGYYTLHVMKDGKTIGMLSVNGINGSVWHHNWHGEVDSVSEFNAAK